MSGYIGPSPVPQSIQRRQSFTATAGQTTFGTTGYTDGDFIDVYLNGVKLVGGTDYTATNGTDIVLTTAASASDVLDFVTFNSLSLANHTFDDSITLQNATEEDTDGGRESTIIFKGEQSGGEISTLAEIEASHDGTADDEKGDLIFRTNDGSDGSSPTERMRVDSAGNISIGNTSTAVGLATGSSATGFAANTDGLASVARDGGTPLNLNRLTSDGDIAVFRKDGTTVGSIGTASSNPYIASTGCGFRVTGASVRPTNTSGANSDNTVDLGFSSARWKDLYLSGGVYVGGTGSANKLDDVEEGTFTLAVTGVTTGPTSTGFSSLTGSYRKVNDKVTCFVSFDFNDSANNFTVDDRWTLNGLPFTPSLSDIYGVGTWWCYGAISSGINAFGHVGISATDAIYFYVTHVDGTLTYTNPIKGVFTYLV